MKISRRRAITLAGVTVPTLGLAGCFGSGDGTPGTGQGSPTPTDSGPNGNADSIEAIETVPFALSTDTRPAWRDEEPGTGRAILIDGEERAHAALASVDRDGIDEAVRALLQDVDYGDERLVLIESIGPDACHSGVEVGNVRVEGDEQGTDGEQLRADATVIDESDDDEACAAVVVAPATLLRVSFADEPRDRIAVAVTDGWGETGTVTASVDDPLGPDPDELAGHVRPDGDPEAVEPLDCPEDDFERHYPGYDGSVHVGAFESDGETTLAMRVDESTYERGDTATVRMTAVADEVVDTGNADKYNLEVYTEEGWQEVRGGEGPFPYTDEAVGHAPGEGFEWRFELTEDGVVADAPHDFRVCPGLPAGRYRFTYWGVIGEGALAVEFDLLD